MLLSFEAWPVAHLLGLMAVEEFSLLPDVIEGTEGVFAVPAEPAFRARLLVFDAARAETPGAMTLVAAAIQVATGFRLIYS